MTSISSVDPFTLRWGVVTLDQVDDRRKVAFHIINHDLTVARATQRTVRFLRGRIEWCRRHLPEGYRQVVVLDDRGQPISDIDRSSIRTSLMAPDVEIRFFSEGVFGGV